MKKIISFLTVLLIALPLYSQPPAPLPEINASSAVLIDIKSGTILYEKNADVPIPPASMTKLMTIHTALRFVNAGTVKVDDIVPVSARADFRNLPPRSSLMFIEQGQKVSLMELLTGLALPSGNDAAIAVAEFTAGSVEAFVDLMNKEASRLGMEKTHFDDASGYSEKNITTAREYAEFCRYYIQENGRYLQTLHTAENFTYPLGGNLPESGKSVHGPITQPNHNILINRMPEVDGLKTGYIDESGYNFAATAALGDRRLVLVTMGGPGKSAYDGALKRALDAARLFSYGFYAWTETTPSVPQNTEIEIRGGERNSLGIQYSRASKILIETRALDDLEFVPYIQEIKLPVAAGRIVGRWDLVQGGNRIIQSGIITAAESVKRGNLLKRLFGR